jgi:plastocyanin
MNPFDIAGNGGIGMVGTFRARSFEGIVTRRRQPIRVNRRQVMHGIGGLGIAALGVAALGRRAGAQEGSPVPAATPVIGPQADGTTLWKVVVGGMDPENMIEYHGFFPGELTINAGDSVWFAEEMPMFHTVTFPNTANPVPLLIPDPEVAATPDPAAPPKLIFNPVMVGGAGSNVVDGSELVSTAVDVFGDPSKPWVFTFPKAGAYEYFCIPHQFVMRGKITVQEAGSTLPMDQAAVDAAAREQIAALQQQGLAELDKYKEAKATKLADGTTQYEVALGAGGMSQVRVQRFLPGAIEINVGDSIKFVNQSEGEPHTATFLGEGETQPEDTIVESFANGMPKFVQSMETFLPSGGNVWSGKGFLNSGFTGIPALGLPMEFTVTFDTPGEFTPYCILHGDPNGEGMAGKVTVKAAS